jgi:polar amino acid transport system substrate-binding protein
MQNWLFSKARGAWLAALSAVVVTALLSPIDVQAAAPAGCAALQTKYPDWKGKTLVNAINPAHAGL